MDEQHKEHLRVHYMALMGGLSDTINAVCGYLFSKKIITKHMKNKILQGNNTDDERAMALLDLLPTRGQYAYNSLYEAALAIELFGVADILNPDVAPHQVLDEKEFDTTEESLPDHWPYVEGITDIDRKIRKITKDDRTIRQLYQQHLVAGQESTYLMKNSKRGQVLIINNETFEHGNFPARTGSDKDKRSLEQLFRTFGFDVIHRNNLKNAEMWKHLQCIAGRIEQKADCFILVILSHGDKGVVFGTDGKRGANGLPENCTKIEDIKKLFSQVPNLRGKPKLFFIQACQGALKDPGLAPGGPEKSSEQKDSGSAAKQVVEDDAVDALAEKLGSLADIYVAMATVADQISWRNTVHGTWFIQAVVYIFAHYGYKYDLNGLMTLVKRLVGKAETFHGFKQVCESTTTMQKTFYFFPGLPLERPT